MLHPVIIQGGMGVAVSTWLLANTVARSGQLGTVSGTALAPVVARRLQDGDPGGHMRRALAQFPVSEIAESVLERYFIPGGKRDDEPYRTEPVFGLEPSKAIEQLTVVANFVEVFLAKEGHDGPVAINYLDKIRLPNLASVYGAMVAGVDYVVVGAGIPWGIAAALDRLAANEDSSLRVPVLGASSGDEWRIHFRPRDVMNGHLPDLKRPRFLAIVASATLAKSLARKARGGVDGFVMEGPTAGGHNAPPRGALQLSERGEPVYGPRDIPDLPGMCALGLPFWLAGQYDTPERVKAALDAGAAGVQVGTSFALCDESGLPADTKAELLAGIARGEADTFTDPLASPTGFPFKVARKSGTLSEKAVYEARTRVCDMGYLRWAYKRDDGSVGYRCPAEPPEAYVRKGGAVEDTVGRKCLCSALMANIGFPQVRAGGYVEPMLLTVGDSLCTLSESLSPDGAPYAAEAVLCHLLQYA